MHLECYISSISLVWQKTFLADLQHSLVGDHDDVTLAVLVYFPQVAGDGGLKFKQFPYYETPSHVQCLPCHQGASFCSPCTSISHTFSLQLSSPCNR